MTDYRAARYFIGLKFRAIVRTPQAMIGLILGLLVGTGLIVVAAVGVWALRDSPNGELALALGLSGLSATWFIGPLVFGGGEVILDVRRFGPLPLSRSTVAVGMFLASFVGVPALISLGVAAATLTHADSLPALILMVVAVVVFVVSIILASRAAISVMTLMFGTRFRAAATAITLLVAASVASASQSVVYLTRWVTIERLETIHSISRWFPTSWAAEALALAANGRLLSAVAFLAAAVVLAAALTAIWARLLMRHMDGEGAEDPTRRRGPLVPAWMDVLVEPRTAAAWARTNRSIRRDPREWSEIAAFLPLVLAFGAPAVTLVESVSPTSMLVAYLAVSSSVAIISSNLFGSDGPNFVADAFPGDGFRSVLIGKTLPRLATVVVLVSIGTVALARFTDGWRLLPVSMVLIGQSALVAATAGIFVSLRSPIPLPDRVGSLAGNNAGCLASLIRIVTLFAINIVTTAWAAPTLAVALLGWPLAALVPGLALLAVAVWWFRWTTDAAGRYMTDRVPELVTALSLRT